MNKQRVKDLCEGNPQLEWWAMVLFAEVCDLVEYDKNSQGSYEKEAYKIIKQKTEEFDHLVIQEMEKQTKERLQKLPSIEERLTTLEQTVFRLCNPEV